MKKVLATVLAFTCAFALMGCGGNAGSSTTTSTASSAQTTDDGKKSEGVMTYAEYAAAELDSAVTVETYVQAKQSWWDNKGTFYTQDKDGGYFIYEMPCTEDEYAKLTEGTKIKVKGYKSEWSGEVEIVDATFEIEDGKYIASPVDVTDKLGTDDLVKFQNQKVSFKGMTVEKANDEGAAFLYKWDGSGSQGDDVYFNVSKDGKTYSFTIRAYLTGKDTEVYKAAEALKVGQTLDLEGFLYWYEGPNPHITSITVK
ncbi:MAG: hypothetical protein ACSW8H_05820 [bacterium]